MVDQQRIPSDTRRRAFPALYERFAPNGLRYAYSLLRNAADCEEVVQEAFCRLLGHADQLAGEDGEGGFAPLFFTTLRNLAIDRMRRRQRRRDVPLHMVAEPVEQNRDPGGVEQLAAAVRKMIEQLPSSWADALRLRVDGQLTYQQISQVLGCSRAQVRTWIYRARREMERQLIERDQEHSLIDSHTTREEISPTRLPGGRGVGM